MLISEIRNAAREARNTLRNIDTMSFDLASLISGRLRNLGNGYYERQILVDLKRELRDFNSHTRKWRNEK